MIAAIVLAAGLGTRMGRIKPLADVDGEAALAIVLRTIGAASIPAPIVVLGAPSADEILGHVDLAAAAVIVNDKPQLGMGHSLGLGLDAVSPVATGVLVFHADMPFVRLATVQGVLRAAEGGALIAAPVHRDRRGFPVFFDRSCLTGLRRSLMGDAGGRSFIAAAPEKLTTVQVDDPGCVYDLDEPADLLRWKGERRCATSA